MNNRQHINSEGERLSIEEKTLRGNRVRCLVIYDDAPPIGTGQAAPMFLDPGTCEFLFEFLVVEMGFRHSKQYEVDSSGNRNH